MSSVCVCACVCGRERQTDWQRGERHRWGEAGRRGGETGRGIKETLKNKLKIQMERDGRVRPRMEEFERIGQFFSIILFRVFGSTAHHSLVSLGVPDDPVACCPLLLAQKLQ